MTERYTEEKFRHPNIALDAGVAAIPIAKGAETFPITLSPFMDHGRPAFITSKIRSSRVLTEVASELTHEESQRLTNGAGKILEEVLDGHQLKSTTVLTSLNKDKPNIYVFTFGNPYNPTGLRLYAHLGEHNGAPVLYQDARARIKSSDRVTRVFKESGYFAPRGMEIKRKNS